MAKQHSNINLRYIVQMNSFINKKSMIDKLKDAKFC
jgi:hypothetical protein